MARRKRPPDQILFEFWLNLGDERTYAAVAEHFSIDKATVTRVARAHHWKRRLTEDVEPRVAERVNEGIVESLASVRQRQAAVGLDLVQKGLAALESFPIVDVRDALKAIELGTKIETQAREMSQKKMEVSVEHILKERHERFVSAEPAPRLPEPRRRIEVDFGELEDELTEADISEVDGELEAERDE